MTPELTQKTDNELSGPERRALQSHEDVIERGIQTFIEVGHRLQEIRDAKLWRGEYCSFDHYCQKRWGWKKPYVSQIISASKTTENLFAIANTPKPTSEGQVRPLTKLKTPEDQYEAWCKANEISEDKGIPVTAKVVQQAVDAVSKPKSAPKDDTTSISNADVECAVNEGTADKAISWVNEIDLDTQGAKNALIKVINHCNKLLEGATK